MLIRNIKKGEGQQLLNVEIRSKRGLIFLGTADGISSRNESGKFDILPLHSNFITLVNETIVVHKTTFGGVSQIHDEYPVERGVVKVFDNKVLIFLSI
jgi:F0F1-type ATP synthase epsilon subunit